MLYVFPDETYAVARRDYDRPHDDPISARRGDVVRPVVDGSVTTDFLGWTWCVGPDGRAGWTPDGWCAPCREGWRLLRDFSALEFTVRKGDRFRLILSESGFVFAERDNGERAWAPDAVLELARPPHGD
jgi:hypothetical protein